MKIYDTFLFFNELDLLEIRLNTLDDIVDYFVITEASATFSGRKKPLYYNENKQRFKHFHNKIIHNVIENTPDDFTNFVPANPYYTDRFISYPHKSNGAPLNQLSLDFQREVFQRDSIINGLIDVANKEDLIIVSDLDEIPNPDAVREVINSFEPGQIYTFCQKWCMYYVNVLCQNEWFGTRICNYKSLSGKSVDLLRYPLESRSEQPGPIVENGGWHFSFLGGQQMVKEKLMAYSYQGRRTRLLLKLLDWIYPNRINKKIEKNLDIFNTWRKFVTVPIDQSFPAYLVANQDRFRELIK